jgi:hypothetical protein
MTPKRPKPILSQTKSAHIVFRVLLYIPYTSVRLEGELGFDPQDDGPSIGDVLGFEGVVSDGFPGFIEAHDGGLIISGGSRTRRGRIDG